MTIYDLLDSMYAASQCGVKNGHDYLQWAESNADLSEVNDALHMMTWQTDDGSLLAAQKTLPDDRFADLFAEALWETRDGLFERTAAVPLPVPTPSSLH